MNSTFDNLLPGYRPRLAVLGLLQACAAACEALTIALLIPLLAAVGASQTQVSFAPFAHFGLPAEPTTGAVLASLIVALAGRTVFQVTWTLLWARTVFTYEQRHRTALVEEFAAAAWARQSREPAGYLQQLLTVNVEYVAKLFTALTYAASHALHLLVLGVYAFTVNFAMSGITLVVLAALFVVARPISARSRRAAAQRAVVSATYANSLAQAWLMLKELRIFGVFPWFAARTAAMSEEIGAARRTQNFLGSLLPIVYQNASALLLIAAAAAAVTLGWSQAASASVVSMLLLIRAVSHGQHLQTFYHQLYESRPYLDQVLAARETYAANRLPTGGRALDRIESIEFDEVGFAYEGRPPVLENVSFRAARGDVVAVVGPSGTGKTTLATLLTGLNTPTRGEVRVNNLPLASLDAATWFARLGFVPQEPILLNETVAECIRFHRPRITDAQVVAAAKEAGIYDEFAAMPAGLQTLVGERGGAISVGQRQRVCIARALATAPDLIVFDEPTSALDARSEAIVHDTIARLRERAVVFVLTHKPATLAACNKVLVLREGGVAAFDDRDKLSILANGPAEIIEPAA